MTDMKPLLMSSDDDFERALLGSVDSDRPLPSGLRDTALALGLGVSAAGALGAGLAVTTTAAVAPLGAASPAATTLVAATASPSAAAAIGAASLVPVAKSLLVGALVSFTALSAIEHTTRPSTSSAPTTVPASTSVARGSEAPSKVTPPAVSASSASLALEETQARLVDAAAQGHPSPSRSRALAPSPERSPSQVGAPNGAFEAVEGAVPAPAAMNAASLAAETRLLDRARSALNAGAADEAGELLAAYAARRPSAVLAQEAALLRVRLLLARGQRAAAAAQARRVISQYPESAHVDSLRRLAAEP